MNVCDVSNHPRHARLLKKAKEEQQAADRRKGQPIQMTKSRLEVIDQLHEEKFEEAVFLNKADSEPTLATVVNISTPYLPSVAPLEDLRKIFLRALKHETHHRGDYMLLRVASAFIVEGTTYFIAEDENEDVIKVHIHYCNRKFMRTYMAQKGVFILKEPFLKSLSEDNYAIQIHHLSDLISIPPTDPILPSSWRRELLPQGSDAVAWAALGDEHYHSGELYHAQDCYEEAFRHNPTEEVADNLRSHMAQVLLIRGNYYAALEELNDVIEPGVKELWLKWEAQYKAREFRKASATFTTISRDHLEGIMDDQTRNQYARTIQRVAERDHAKYKFGEMQMSARNLEELSECASYVRFIRLGYLSATQRPGLFAEKEFQAGDLIFCEKAFRYRNDEVEGSIWMTVNAETNSITVGTQPNLVRKIAEQMYNNPPVIGSICALYSADFKTVDPLQVVNGRQVVDSFLVERIVACNCFGCPPSTYIEMSQSVRSGTSSETTAKNYPSCGLWPWAAQMKHSCDSNVRYSFINDMMIVRAARNIPRDTELTIWHQSPLITEQIDKRMVIPRLNFECNCPVCTDILNTSKKGSRKRARLRLEILSTLNCVKPDTEKVEDLLAEIEKTFVKPVHESRRFALWELYHKLAEVYLSRARRPKMVECLLKSLEALGFIIENAIIPNTRRLEVKKWGIAIPNTVLTWILISLYYKYEGYKDKEKQAAEYARITYRICIGEDDTFDQYHSAYFMFSQSTET